MPGDQAALNWKYLFRSSANREVRFLGNFFDDQLDRAGIPMGVVELIDYFVFFTSIEYPQGVNIHNPPFIQFQ